MAQPKKFDAAENPLTVLYKTLCNALFDDDCGVNETAYSALMILGDAIDKKTRKQIDDKIVNDGGRYKYLE